MVRALTAGAELLGWWAALTLLWIMLIGPVDTLEWAVGAGAGLVAAAAARGARRAAGDR
ncbi:hypothetical protein [Streptomyces endophytica]|uniref:Uncharacterized protein n=1 Tax=Streptomyces endophytica TaxID=2991496 RepID=A0ABY6PG20_9ACTN|nr:hypothetical protein [Streptomyces endophytica]UZJ32492.1 hypothetical protein OJ254_22190 [Streptomyces endophytica]